MISVSLIKDPLVNAVAMTAFGLCFIPIIACAVTYDAGRSVIQPLLEKDSNR